MTYCRNCENLRYELERHNSVMYDRLGEKEAEIARLHDYAEGLRLQFQQEYDQGIEGAFEEATTTERERWEPVRKAVAAYFQETSSCLVCAGVGPYMHSDDCPFEAMQREADDGNY